MEDENRKIVLNLILDFLRLENGVGSEGLLGSTGILGLIDSFLLVEIAEKVILQTKKEKEIKKILKNFDEFKITRYRQVLEKEKIINFKNLKFIVEKRKNLKGLI